MMSMRRPQGIQLPGRRLNNSRLSTESRLSRMSATTRSARVSALTERLEEALVFIIHQDGRREYETMTLRQLYNYVLQAIATRPEGLAYQSSRNVVLKRSAPPITEVVKKPSESLVSNLSGSDKSGGVLVEKVEKEVVVEEETAADESDASDSYSASNEEETSDNKDANKPTNQESEQKKQVSFDTTAHVPSRRATVTVDRPACSTETVTYRERLGGYLHPRDMRRLVTPFSTTNAPELMVRRHVILLNCDPLRAIVLRDRLLVLVPDGADSILELLGKRILGGRQEMEDSVFGTRHGDASKTDDSAHLRTSEHRRQIKIPGLKTGRGKEKETSRGESGVTDATVVDESVTDEETLDSEWEDLQGRSWIDMPFELKAVDAVLHTVSLMLAEDVDNLQNSVYDTVDEVLGKGRAGAGDHNQQLLRAYKNEIKEMTSRVDNFVRAINESLDDLEDLTLMNLSRLLTHPERFIQPVPEEVLNEESDEPELILEVYLQQALSIANQLDLLNGQVTSSEELMAMQLDTVRNNLLYINAVVSVFTLTISIAALVGSIYGMNVINGREEDPGAFTTIVIGTSIGCVIFICILLFVFYRAMSLPNVAS